MLERQKQLEELKAAKDKKEAEGEESGENDGEDAAEESNAIQLVDGKLYQSQIEKLKIIKGAGEMNPDPCTKGMGYLSIEKAKDVPIVVYRTLTGSIHF